MSNKIQYALDVDYMGNNIDNLVTKESHKLSGRDIRAMVPRMGLFYGDSLVVRDGANILRVGFDYRLHPEHQYLTVKTGKPVFAGIVVVNPKVGSDLTLQYQAVGGPYETNNKTIAELSEMIINDSRPVDHDNVFNKPEKYPPLWHQHVVGDLTGFEEIVFQLERLRYTISRTQVNVVFEAVNMLLNRFNRRDLPKIVSSSKVVQYDALLYALTRRMIASNCWIDTARPEWIEGRMAEIEIGWSQEGHYAGTAYWFIYKEELVKLNSPIVSEGSVPYTVTYDLENDPHKQKPITKIKVPIYIPTGFAEEPETIYLGLRMVETGTMEPGGDNSLIQPNLTEIIEEITEGLPQTHSNGRKVAFKGEFQATSYRINIVPAIYTGSNTPGNIFNNNIDSDFARDPVMGVRLLGEETFYSEHNSLFTYE